MQLLMAQIWMIPFACNPRSVVQPRYPSPTPMFVQALEAKGHIQHTLPGVHAVKLAHEALQRPEQLVSECHRFLVVHMLLRMQQLTRGRQHLHHHNLALRLGNQPHLLWCLPGTVVAVERLLGLQLHISHATLKPYHLPHHHQMHLSQNPPHHVGELQRQPSHHLQSEATQHHLRLDRMVPSAMMQRRAVPHTALSAKPR